MHSDKLKQLIAMGGKKNRVAAIEGAMWRDALEVVLGPSLNAGIRRSSSEALQEFYIAGA